MFVYQYFSVYPFPSIYAISILMPHRQYNQIGIIGYSSDRHTSHSCYQYHYSHLWCLQKKSMENSCHIRFAHQFPNCSNAVTMMAGRLEKI